LAGIASDRSAALAGLLPAAGWEPIVITTQTGFYHRSTESSPPDIQVLRTPAPELSPFVRRIYARGRGLPSPADSTTVTPVEAGRLGSGARSLLRDFVYIPDAQLGWIPFAARAAARAIRESRRPAVLWSSSVPYSAHVAAMRAARRTGAKWVAEFRDPWTTAYPTNLPASRARREIDLCLERRIVSAADHLVVLSDSTREALLTQHPTLTPGRVSVVTNGFVSRDVGKPPPPAEPMSILYAGTVAPGEDPALILAGLDKLQAERPDSFRLRVLGPAGPWLTSGGGERPWLELPGVVSPGEAHAEMRNSSALLVLQRHPAYRIVLPGKSFEYVGSRRPIIAAVPSDWELLRMLEQHADVRRVDPLTADGLREVVQALLDEHVAGQIQQPRVPEARVAPLRREVQARKLAAIFDQLASAAA
jgi:glycosyltransferase involved in cell wall biosynthesis